MRDWEQYVRDHLSLPDLTRDREARIRRELAAQLEDFYREAIARGMSDADADAHARAQITDWPHLAETLNGVERTHRRSSLDRWSERFDDRARERRGRWVLFADCWQDIRYAGRRLLAQPGFTAVAVLTLALGIGANSAIFSLIDALLLDSLPVERPRELALLVPAGLRNGWATRSNTWSYQAYLGLRERQRVFSGLIAERTDAVTLTIDGVAQRAIASMVSGNYFDVLGVRPLKGRLLTEADDRLRSGHPVVVLSYGFWVDRLGMQPDIVGRDVRIGGYPFTVVGIGEPLPEGAENDGHDRGVIFMTVQASLARQFEFVQAQWANTGNPFRLGDDQDPIIGPQDAAPAKMTVPGRPPFFVGPLSRVVTTRGGEYYFAPGINGLRHLAAG